MPMELRASKDLYNKIKPRYETENHDQKNLTNRYRFCFSSLSFCCFYHFLYFEEKQVRWKVFTLSSQRQPQLNPESVYARTHTRVRAWMQTHTHTFIHTACMHTDTNACAYTQAHSHCLVSNIVCIFSFRSLSHCRLRLRFRFVVVFSFVCCFFHCMCFVCKVQRACYIPKSWLSWLER